MKDRTANGIPRRAFLVSSVGSAGLLIPGPIRTACAAVSDDPRPRDGRPSDRIRIGYLPDSENFSSLENLTHSAEGFVDVLNRRVDDQDCSESSYSRIIDAASVRRGDPRFAETGVRMRIHGLFMTPETRMSDLPSLHLYAHAASTTPVPFYAWGYQSDAAGTCGAACDHSLPVSSSGGLTLSFDVRDAGCGSAKANPLDADFCADHALVRFGLDGSRDSLKLRRGLYFVAFTGGTQSPGRWQDHFAVETAQTVQEEFADSISPILTRLTQTLSLFSKPLAYVLLSLDHAQRSQLP